MNPLILLLLVAQGTRADYERAENFKKLVEKQVYRSQVRPSWSPDSSKFWYRVIQKDGARQYILVDVATGRRAPGASLAAGVDPGDDIEVGGVQWRQ